jgi:drug/metabolite transporter (DMT)-like permease
MKNLFRSATFLAIVACWLWSTAFASVKIGLQYQKPFHFAGLRFLLAGILIFLWFGKPGRYLREVIENWKFILVIAFVQTFLQYAFFYTGMNMVPGALGAMLVGSSPLFIAIVAHLFSEDDKITLSKTLSILAGVAGLALITLGRSRIRTREELEWLGILFLIVNNFLSGYANVLVKKNPEPVSPYVLSSASLIIGGILFLLVSLPAEGIKNGPFPWIYYLALGWLSFISAAALTIWYALLKRPGVKVSELNSWKFIIPVSGAFLSWSLVKGERPDFYSILGMVVIAVSLVAISYGKNKAKKSLSPTSPPSG